MIDDAIAPDPIEVANAGARWLARAINSKGRFRYQIEEDGRVDPTQYNILRHCGTIWAIAECVMHAAVPRSAVEAPLRRAAKHLIDTYTMPARHGRGLCVVEFDQYKLGGNALAVVALTEMLRLSQLPAWLSIAEQLGVYMLDRRGPGGELVHKHDYGDGTIGPWRSGYYDGQAAFAWLRLYQATGSPKWLEAAETLLEELRARQHGVANQDHWTLYALEQQQAARPDQRWIDYAEQIASQILDDPGYRDDQRATPIACRSEGLLAYLRLAGTQIERDRRTALVAALRQNLILQLQSRRPDGSFVEAATGGNIRIDYVQHNIAAFLGYARLRDEGPIHIGAVVA